ncbi:hypothetical protein WME89_02410 [Sorangium sp. So ce321]|uniref:hypothetical protein n=1 Tax=Sorangium sp. So ce321 TaxID=3133300 RepID=UPI003F6388AE
MLQMNLDQSLVTQIHGNSGEGHTLRNDRHVHRCSPHDVDPAAELEKAARAQGIRARHAFADVVAWARPTETSAPRTR